MIWTQPWKGHTTNFMLHKTTQLASRVKVIIPKTALCPALIRNHQLLFSVRVLKVVFAPSEDSIQRRSRDDRHPEQQKIPGRPDIAGGPTYQHGWIVPLWIPAGYHEPFASRLSQLPQRQFS
uniref:Uncharacterized protein n=1 Tax=Steinernema glaseri TaxID=37863 RepID=A0A1I7ZBN9_9BILA